VETPEAEPWSREEVEAIVAVYIEMLEKQLVGTPFNKAEINRQLAQILVGRSKHSIERKHGNISAVLLELGYGYLSGYKPLPHYQNLLKSVIEDHIAREAHLEDLFSAFVHKLATAPPGIPDILAMQVGVPKAKKAESYVSEKRRMPPPPGRKNYLELEARNGSLGRAGEEVILKFEHERLRRAGRRDLADRIEHVSANKGDYLGFDVLSFETDGRDRLIEVKTTRFGALTPFFATKNEVQVSEMHNSEYQLYRLYEFDTEPHFFALSGSLRHTCLLEPTQFSAVPG
jgi:hypothetical protein